jgi:hypothetical protein
MQRVAIDRDGDTACGNPACSGRWLTFLKDRRRPVFERQWGCSVHCLETMLQTAIHREVGDEVAVGPDEQHRHRVPLGLILLAQGLISQRQLQHALETQRHAQRGRIGEWLIDECELNPACVTRGLSIQWSCPVLSLDGFDPAPISLTVPKLLVEQLGILPVRIAGARILYLAFVDRLDASVAFAMERMSGLKAQSGLVDETRWKAAHQSLCNCSFVDAACEHVANVEMLPGKMAAAIHKFQPRASRVVRVHQFYWLRMWLESGAMSTPDGGVPATGEDIVDCLYLVGAEQ